MTKNGAPSSDASLSNHSGRATRTAPKSCISSIRLVLLVKQIVRIDGAVRRLDPHDHALRLVGAIFAPRGVKQDGLVRHARAQRIGKILDTDVTRAGHPVCEPIGQRGGKHAKIAHVGRNNRRRSSGCHGLGFLAQVPPCRTMRPVIVLHRGRCNIRPAPIFWASIAVGRTGPWLHTIGKVLESCRF